MHLPDALGIFAHGAVGGENAAAGNVDERQTRARGGVCDRGVQPLMRGGVIIKVGEEQVRVAAVEQLADKVGVALAVGEAFAEA